MTPPEFQGLEDDAPLTARERLGAVLSRIRDWASTETGGWTIVAALAFLAVAGLTIALFVPRGAAPPPPDTEATRTAAAQAELGPLTDLTLSPDQVQDLSQDAARAWNAALPFATTPVLSARPFLAPAADIQTYGRALDCLTAAVYYEAGYETAVGQAAVAQVVLNRTRHPAYPRTVCGVVFQGSERTTGCQFTFTCDGAMARKPSAEGWARARAVATAALNGMVTPNVGMATHYHTDWVAPYWAPRLNKIVQIGAHIFYRWNGAWGLPAAFTGVYVGAEPDIEKMKPLSTAVLEPEPAVEEPVIEFDPIEVGVGSAFGPRSDPMIVLTESDAVASPAPAVVTPPEPEAPVVAATARPPEPTIADPLVNPAQAPQRPRTRIAAPSNW